MYAHIDDNTSGGISKSGTTTPSHPTEMLQFQHLKIILLKLRRFSRIFPSKTPIRNKQIKFSCLDPGYLPLKGPDVGTSHGRTAREAQHNMAGSELPFGVKDLAHENGPREFLFF